MPKRMVSKQDSGGCAPIHDFLTEFTNARSSLTFEQLFRGDGDKTKADLRRLLSRRARIRRGSTAALAVPKAYSISLESVQVETCGHETKALLDFGAVFNLTSKKICNKLHPEADRHPNGLSTAHRQRVRLIRSFQAVSVLLASVI